MASTRDYPEDLFHDCDSGNRDRHGAHADQATDQLERRCKNALWELVKTNSLRLHDATALRAYLQPIDAEGNACERELERWPRRWRQVFYGRRSQLEIRVNNYWNMDGVQLNLPWGYTAPDWKTEATHNPRVEVRQARSQQTAQTTARRGASAAQRAAAAALDRQTHAQPEESHTARHRSQKDEERWAQSLRPEQTYRAARSPAAQTDTSRPNAIHGRSTRTDHNAAGRPPPGIEADTPILPRTQPMSDPRAGQRGVVTLTGMDGQAQQQFHLVRGRRDSSIRNAVAEVERKIQAAKIGGVGDDRILEIALNAIQENIVEQVAESAAAGGDIWVAPEGRHDIVMAFLDMPPGTIGTWSLFGIGTGISVGKMYLLQQDGPSG